MKCHAEITSLFTFHTLRQVGLQKLSQDPSPSFLLNCNFRATKDLDLRVNQVDGADPYHGCPHSTQTQGYRGHCYQPSTEARLSPFFNIFYQNSKTFMCHGPVSGEGNTGKNTYKELLPRIKVTPKRNQNVKDPRARTILRKHRWISAGRVVALVRKQRTSQEVRNGAALLVKTVNSLLTYENMECSQRKVESCKKIRGPKAPDHRDIARYLF